MQDIAFKLAAILKAQKKMIVTAESCTGGMIGARFTDAPGSSSYYAGGFITYSNDLKMKLLSVREQTLTQFGAVSLQCAKEMVNGALRKTDADLAISVTGIAGPDGGSEEKPVGLVYVGLMHKGGKPEAHELHLEGERADIRTQTVDAALSLAYESLQG